MDADSAWHQIEQVLSGTRHDQKNDILYRLHQWLESSDEEQPLSETPFDEASSQLDDIAAFIRNKLPFEAQLPSEKIVTPTSGDNADCNPETTIHIDAFLYPDAEVDKLCDNGILSTYYCADCGSRKTRPLTIISHSASKDRTQFIYQKLLPPDLLNGATVVDVGSRLGVLCYGAYLMSTAERIVGVELNADLCALQESVVQEFAMTDRIQIVNADILNLPEVLAEAKAVIINNSFEFFSDNVKQREIWAFIARNCKPGCALVTVPSLEEAFASLEVPTSLIDVARWVRKIPVNHDLSNPDIYGGEDSFAEAKGVHLYEVVHPMV
ncbi:hypothetical protein BIW11_01411 [Tropilaelaps mercedesae]|uniref:Methyltransferase type 11 domain-containing protein n=1 Tax=Tropilaelaps mercedesae TaxID=418985 RepID=A0A1V9XEA7_9ACAR|nr:hypothetical protein BIW11_01411 [Tropilaelaps mercedesae]